MVVETLESKIHNELKYIEEMIGKTEYVAEGNYVVAVIEICNCKAITDTLIQYTNVSAYRGSCIVEMIKEELEGEHCYVDIEKYQEKIMLIFHKMQESEVYEIVYKLCEKIEKKISKDEAIFSAVGCTVNQKKNINRSYIIAYRIVELLKLDGREGETVSYSNTGTGKVLLNVDDVQSLDDFYQETIGPLERNDVTYGTRLVETLESYMNNNGNMQDTANDLHVHKGSVLVKIKKIEELLEVSISDFNVRNQLMTGLLIGKLRKISEI